MVAQGPWPAGLVAQGPWPAGLVRDDGGTTRCGGVLPRASQWSPPLLGTAQWRSRRGGTPGGRGRGDGRGGWWPKVRGRPGQLRTTAGRHDTAARTPGRAGGLPRSSAGRGSDGVVVEDQERARQTRRRAGQGAQTRGTNLVVRPGPGTAGRGRATTEAGRSARWDGAATRGASKLGGGVAWTR